MARDQPGAEAGVVIGGFAVGVWAEAGAANMRAVAAARMTFFMGVPFPLTEVPRFAMTASVPPLPVQRAGFRACK